MQCLPSVWATKPAYNIGDMTMNRTITLSLMILSFLLPSITHADEPKGIPLIEKGLSQHVIVLSETASPSEKTAANELQLHINACTGAELPILTEKPAADTPMIVLGCGPLAKTLGVDPAKDQLGEQGFVIKTVDNHIVIAGTPEAGTLYGVHRFLEDYFNVRWYAPEETKTPKTNTITIPKIDRLEKPAFPYRRTSWYNNTLKDQAFITRVAQNSGNGQADYPWGIQYTFLGTCHSYFRFINPKTYFAEHPEYFLENRWATPQRRNATLSDQPRSSRHRHRKNAQAHERKASISSIQLFPDGLLQLLSVRQVQSHV